MYPSAINDLADEAINQVALEYGYREPEGNQDEATPEELAWARSKLIDFSQFTYKQYEVEPMHELIAQALDQVVDGYIKRLMIFAPPQHGKSELVSVRLPAYWMGKRPNDPVMITSYGASLAESKSSQVRDIVESDEFKLLFPGVTTKRGSRAVAQWSLDRPYRGGMKAAGVGGPITGHGAGLGIVDDPFASWEDGQSKTIRQKTWEWYTGTFRTRLRKNGVIVIIMTRWHEDDIAGRLLMNNIGGQWEVLRLPAIAEDEVTRRKNNIYLGLPENLPDPLHRKPGEALAPNRYDIDTLIEIQTDAGPMVWASEYQQIPRALEGTTFKREWFEIVDEVPRIGRLVRYWDKSANTGSGAATAGVLMLYTPDKMVYILDVVRGFWETTEREKVMKQTADLDAIAYGIGVVKQWIEQEPGSGGKDSADMTIRNLAGHAVYPDKVTGSKDTRMQPFVAQAGARNVKIKRGKWNGVYIEELVSIPNGSYRDQADASGGAYTKLANIGSKAVQKRIVGLYGKGR